MDPLKLKTLGGHTLGTDHDAQTVSRHAPTSSREDVLNRLRQHRAHLEQIGVARVYRYGSIARDGAQSGSDVDLLIEPKDEEFWLFDMIGVQDACIELLGRATELHDYRGLVRAQAFQARVRADLVNVF